MLRRHFLTITSSLSLSFLVNALFAVATMAIVVVLLLSNACAENRVALVIGNAAYPTAPLSNPWNDANAMQEILIKLGFDVTKRVDAGRKEMRAIIRQFGERLQRPDTVALFFYSGHGNQVNGRNYMIPVDADVRSEIDIESDGVFVGEVLQTMEASNSSVNIVILDACRDNPYEKSFKTMSKGLARMEAPNGTLIVYATAPGAVADNGPAGGYSPFTAALIDAIAIPNISAIDMFNEVSSEVYRRSRTQQRPQRPYIEVTTLPRFTFNPKVILQGPPSPTEISKSETTVTGIGRPTERTPIEDFPTEENASGIWFVFFDERKSVLAPAAIARVRAAADAYHKYGATNILLIGYDDLSGSPQDGQLISKRRVTSVANQLMGQGVSRDSIYVAARGQKDPLVPTSRGIAEPQNRRLKIVIDPTPKDISNAGAGLYAAWR